MIKKTLTLLSALLAASLLSAPAQEISSPWKGARVAFLGDSITDQRQLATQDIFWHQLEQILGIQPYVYGISGHRCKHIKGQAEKLYDEHGTDVDAIIIFVGTNDFNGSIPPGEWYSEETAWSNRNGREVQLKHRSPILTGGTVRSDINIFLSYKCHRKILCYLIFP